MSKRSIPNRRLFLQTAIGSTSMVAFGSGLRAAGGVPNCWADVIRSAEMKEGDKSLVIIQLTGGNDGLNTVIPYGDDEYYRNRFALGIGKESVHKLNDYAGLHPSMSDLASLYQDGSVAVVQGVGYPQPNRSHFESMDLWHTAHRKSNRIPTGWLGRYLDDTGTENSLGGIHLGSEEQPLALAAESIHSPTIASVEQFKINAHENEKVNQFVRQDQTMPTNNNLLAHIESSRRSALKTSDRIQEAIAANNSVIAYPQNGLGQKLRSTAQLIDAELGVRVFYLTLDGFDTHSNQGEAHASLLQELSDSVGAFYKDLKARSRANQVTTFVFSEFGRRVRENASQGTDHGAAAPALLIGGGVTGGMYGTYPSLTDLDDGDLKYQVDYRALYAELLEGVLDVPSKPILGESYKRLGIL